MLYLSCIPQCLISRVNVVLIDVIQHLRHNAGQMNNTFKGVKLHLFARVNFTLV